MSPSEDDLRAALRAGEGDPLDPDAIVAGARAARRQRGVRAWSAAVAVVIVAAGSTGLAVWQGSDDGSQTETTRGPAEANRPQSEPAGQPSLPTTPTGIAAGASCPAASPAVPPSAAQAHGALGRLFPESPDSLVVCSYAVVVPTPSNVKRDLRPIRLVVSGAQARELVDSLEHASTARPNQMCPEYLPADATSLVIYGVTASGAYLPPVSAQVGAPPCSRPVTNGTAVRYNWTPPGSLAPLVAQLLARDGSPVGRAHGSPIHS